MTARLPMTLVDADALAELTAEVRALRRDMALLLARTDRAVDPAVAAFLQAVDQAWGNGPWRAGELISWASDPAFAGRRAVLTAAAALTGVPATAHRLGLRLAALDGMKADGLELVREGAKERGARLWAVVRCASSG